MRTIIFGTDWWDDCDDAVALRLLCAAHKRGEIKLGGVVINAVSEYSVPSVDGFLSLEKIDDIPIAVDFDATDYPGKLRYQQRLAGSATRYTNNSAAQPAVRLYRRVLARSQDKVDLVEVGFLQAVAALIESEPDDISPLSGIELMKQKCRKLWAMAGKWDEDGGRENNICKTLRSAKGAAVVTAKCPVPITFLGYEVGASVISGSQLDKNDHLHLALADYGGPNGRSSWDPMTALLTLVGDEEKAGYTCVCGTASVDANTGKNYFVADENGAHKYVVKTKPDEYYAAEIDKRIAADK